MQALKGLRLTMRHCSAPCAITLQGVLLSHRIVALHAQAAVRGECALGVTMVPLVGQMPGKLASRQWLLQHVICQHALPCT